MGYLGRVPGDSSSFEGTETRQTLIATGGQTVFNTFGYDPSLLQVFLNGVLLDTSDYTASNGTSITLGVAALVNEELTIVSKGSANLVNTNAAPSYEVFSGNGVQTQFTLANVPNSVSMINVFISGVLQTPNTDFGLSGGVLTFASAPASGAGNIVVYKPVISYGMVGVGSGGGGATGGGNDEVFYENGTTVTTSYELSMGKNAVSVGPITINDGIAVTIPSGKRWVIL
jgi:hypothetical protein